MNTQSQVEQAQILLEVAKGGKGQAMRGTEGQFEDADFKTLLHLSSMGMSIRLAPLSFPDLPEGEEWYFGEPVGRCPTVEEFGDGWRPLLYGEAPELGDEYWQPSNRTWKIPAGESSPSSNYETLRTKRPLPERKPKFALGEIRPNSNSCHWSKGGTGITNFSSVNLQKYIKAVVAYGDTDLWIESGGLNGVVGQYSLHKSGCGDLSAFWTIYREQVTFKKVRISSEDWKGQPVVWVRISPDHSERLIVAHLPNAYRVESGMDSIDGKRWIPFSEDIFEEYSFNRTDWRPFEKGVEA